LPATANPRRNESDRAGSHPASLLTLFAVRGSLPWGLRTVSRVSRMPPP
jgi:hypothetical protein